MTTGFLSIVTITGSTRHSPPGLGSHPMLVTWDGQAPGLGIVSEHTMGV